MWKIKHWERKNRSKCCSRSLTVKYFSSGSVSYVCPSSVLCHHLWANHLIFVTSRNLQSRAGRQESQWNPPEGPRGKKHFAFGRSGKFESYCEALHTSLSNSDMFNKVLDVNCLRKKRNERKTNWQMCFPLPRRFLKHKSLRVTYCVCWATLKCVLISTGFSALPC